MNHPTVGILLCGSGHPPWDADFFLGDTLGKEFVLCEINASCVSPFPESAITPLIGELQCRLEARQAAGTRPSQCSPS